MRNETYRAGEKGYTVPNTKTTLIEGKSTDADFKKAAVALAAAGEAVDKVSFHSISIHSFQFIHVTNELTTTTTIANR